MGHMYNTIHLTSKINYSRNAMVSKIFRTCYIVFSFVHLVVYVLCFWYVHSKKCLVNYAPTLKTGSKNNHEKDYFDCKRGYNFDHES